MILFAVPTAVALANRPTQPPRPRHRLSIWKLLGGEIAHTVRAVAKPLRRNRRSVKTRVRA